MCYLFGQAHCLVLPRRTKSVCGVDRKDNRPDVALLLLTGCVIFQSHVTSQSPSFFISNMEVAEKNKGRIGLSISSLSAVTN